jgi:predicted dithiol-disulfide oxidoreductase (DUF899 family)
MSPVPHATLDPTRKREHLEREQRIARLMEELENLRRSLPAHSVKPTMLLRIEELEEEIESLKRQM